MSESGRLERLAGDLIDLARLRMQRLSFDVEPVDIRVVVREVVDAFRPTVRENGLSIEIDVARAGEPIVRADRDRVAQVLANLVENAAGFARQTVAVSLRPPLANADPSLVVLDVQDDGPGISADEQRRVFERFHQVDQVPGRRLGRGVGNRGRAGGGHARNGGGHVAHRAGPEPARHSHDRVPSRLDLHASATRPAE